MSICPHCQAENTSGATVCHACGKPLTTTAAGEGLPLWLQALNPEGQVEDMVVAQAHTPPPTDRDKTSPAAKTLPRTEAAQQANEQDVQVAHGQAAHPAVVQPATAAPETDTVVAETQAAPQKTANETPSFAMPTAPRSGTDTVIATQPTIAARSGGAAPTTTVTNETASLISEDDLPAWLRAFSEPEHNGKAATDEDQSWMLGSSATISDEQEASDLAQSWQAPPRATAVERTNAAAIFAAPTASPTNVTKHERLITPIAPPPVVKQPVAVPIPKAGAATATPMRLGAGRPAPATPAHATSSVQRMAIIAFLAALLIFLVVLAIFVVAPALRG